MIRAKTSGVLYKVDPYRPASGQARIDAALGMGEQVVGGAASPDVFHIDRESLRIAQRIIRSGVDSQDGGESQSAVKGLDCPFVEELLDQTGRLLG